MHGSIPQLDLDDAEAAALADLRRGDLTCAALYRHAAELAAGSVAAARHRMLANEREQTADQLEALLTLAGRSPENLPNGPRRTFLSLDVGRLRGVDAVLAELRAREADVAAGYEQAVRRSRSPVVREALLRNMDVLRDLRRRLDPVA